jgi:hypothetical protein
MGDGSNTDQRMREDNVWAYVLRGSCRPWIVSSRVRGQEKAT